MSVSFNEETVRPVAGVLIYIITGGSNGSTGFFYMTEFFIFDFQKIINENIEPDPVRLFNSHSFINR